MDNVKILEVKQSIFASNDEQAAALRAELKQEKIFLLNLMSAPGSGKTTTLRRTIAALQNELRIGVMEADIDSDVDARAIAETGAKAIQLHTGGMCHLDAEMTRQGLAGLGTGGLDLVILENVGNLVCPAEFDTGAVKNAMILSVPEGHDKPLKYPLMFQVCDVVLVNKIDVLPYFDFDMDKCREYVALRNPNARVIPICARTGEGIDEWADWLKEQVKVVFESANFHGATVRITAKALGMRTEASGRFEKGLDPRMTLDAVNRACVIVGVRPVHVHLADNGIDATVDVSELMGSELHLHVNSAGKDVVIVVPTTDIDIDSVHGGHKAVKYSFRPDLMHFFDKKTEKNLF